MTRLAVASTVAALAALAATAGPAEACSCVGIDDPRRTLLESDAGFVGRLVSRRTVGGGQRAVFVFRVEEAVKGRFGKTVEVESASSGAACGLEVSPGASVGLYLQREGGRWTSSLCRQIPPDRMRAAARPLPRPDGRPPIALLAGGTVGRYRTLALDRLGRTLAYGGPSGMVTAIAICPGSRRAVEIVFHGARTTYAVRDLRTFRVVRAALLRGSYTYRSLACRDAVAADVLAYADHHGDGEDLLLRLRRGGARTVWRGRARAATVTRSRALVTAGTQAGVPQLLVVAPDGRGRRAALLPRATEALTPSPDARFAAGVALPGGSGRVVLVDLRSGSVRTARLPNGPAGGTAAWLGPRRFAVLPVHFGSELRTFAVPLRAVGTVTPWRAVTSTLLGRRAVGVERGGALVAAALPGGRPRTLRTIPSGAVYSLVPVRATAR